MSSTTLLPSPEVVMDRPPAQGAPSRGLVLRDQGFFSTALEGTPWKVGDVVRLATRQALALIGLVIAWVGCSGSLDFRDQAAWTAGAVLALVVGASGGVAWVLSGLGCVGRERRLVGARIRELYLTTPEPLVQVASKRRLVTGTGMLRYHRDDCDVVRGKHVRPVRLDTSDSDLKPCQMCLS
jgi:hypothetical protein